MKTNWKYWRTVAGLTIELAITVLLFVLLILWGILGMLHNAPWMDVLIIFIAFRVQSLYLRGVMTQK